jgi:serine/threonine-protein kinase
LNHVIQRCLAKDPERRYQTALDLRNELETLRETLHSAASTASGRVPRGAGGPPAPPEPKRIVVLPFENLGAGDDAYFAAGITEEITSRLAAVSGLAVASRTTAVQYDRVGKTLRQVGADLRVEFVLEGTVRWARKGDTSRVRVTPQLIRVSDDSHLWADRYDRDLDDIFDVQSEIAKSVVENLGVTLLEPERDAVAARPTQNMEAYQAYLRGLDYAGRLDYSPENFERAVRMFQRAVDLDPAFALAHALLGYHHAQMHFFGFDRHPDRLARAKVSADKALELDPDLPEAHRALGKYYYAGPRDYAKAIEEYEITRRGYPNRADILVDLAAAYRRQSEFEKALELFAQAESLEPTIQPPSFESGVCCLYLRRPQEAESAFARVISLAPDQGMAYAMSATNRIHGTGDLAGARKFLETSVVDQKSMIASGEPVWVELLLMERNYRGLEEWIDRHLPSVQESQFGIITANQLHGLANALLGDESASRAAYRASLVFLVEESRKRPSDPRLRAALGLGYAGLEEKDAAIREGEEAVRLLPVERDSMVGAALEEQLARILTRLGEHDAALDRIERLLSIPSLVSVHTLRLDPRWDPLREHPRFRALIQS